MVIEIIILLIIFILVILQSIVGVGILVIGTPILLIFNYNLIEIMEILLPVSICTSLINLSYLKINKKKLKVESQKKYRQYFFLVCVPAIFFGLFLLKLFEQRINFNYLVAIVIIFSYFLAKQWGKIKRIENKTKITSLFFTGIIHGLTNSGGSLLSLMVSSVSNKNSSRYNITFFYFFLALSQYLIFLFIFGKSEILDKNYLYFLFIPIGVYLGIFFEKFFNEKVFKSIISTIALFSAIVLLLS